MGFISDLRKSNNKAVQSIFSGRDAATDLWRDTFGQVSKEDQNRFPPVRGGSYGRSMIASPEAYKRLLQAMRSLAPGGWSDNRWEQSKHFTGIQYACLHRGGEQLAQSEFQIYERDDNHLDGKKPISRTHPGYRLHKILEEPNNEDSWGDMIYWINQQMGLEGMALTWMVPNRLGVPMELYVIPTAIAIPQPAINPDYPDGYYRIQPIYPYGPFSSYPTPATAVGAPIPAQWMLRMKYSHPLLRYDGYAPQTAMRLHLDEIESIDRSRWYGMKRMIQPSAVLNSKEVEGAQPFPEAEIERMRAEFENDHQGPENHGRIFVPPPGFELEQWGSTNKEMEYHQSWIQLLEFVMGAGFGTPKSVVGMLDDVNYATLFASLKQYTLLSLQPMCKRIGHRFTRGLAPFFGDDLIVEIKPPRIDDHEVAFNKVDKMIAGKLATKNEARKLLELPVTQEPWGEEIVGYGAEEPEVVDGVFDFGEDKDGSKPGRATKVTSEVDGSSLTNDHKPPESRVEPSEISKDRPSPGNLNRGSLGPRKGLSYEDKGFNRLHERIRAVVRGKALESGNSQPVIQVNIPQAQPPVVNVNVPQSQPPDVVVNVPPARLSHKKIEYDNLGRPIDIKEVENEVS